MSIIFAIFVVITCARAQSVNYVDNYYNLTTPQILCETRYTRTCSFFGFYCSNQSYNHCWKVTPYERVCKAGWTAVSTLCTIPLCPPGCPAGQTCNSPNNCQCLNPQNCVNVPCSTAVNCYPGTCINNQCKCDTSFKGDNCQISQRTPEIANCTVKVTNRDNTNKTFDFSSGRMTSDVYSVRPSIAYITINYRVIYNPGANVFPAVNFIKENKFGVASSKVSLLWNNATIVQRECQGLNNINPTNYKECTIIINFAESGANQTLNANTNVKITVEAALGGTKYVKSQTFWQILSPTFISQPYTAAANENRTINLLIEKTNTNLV